MATYQTVPGSRGPAPRFEITVGLAEGYGPSAKLHTTEEVVEFVLAHLKARAATGQAYLTGGVTTGTVVYAWPEGPGAAGGGHEPQAVYSGNVNPLYNADLTTEQVVEVLNDLAGELGAALGQSRVYVSYAGDLWILQAEDTETPTGEAV